MRRALLSSALLLSITGMLLSSACSSNSGSAPTAPRLPATPATSQAGFYGGTITPPQLKPAFTLTDTAGNSFDFQRDTANTITVLYFGYTHCPDICPVTMGTLKAALAQAGPDVASHVKVVFVTTDPARDDGPTIRAWLDHFDTSFIGLTGTDAEIAAAEQAAGLPASEKEPLEGGGYAVSHAAWTTVYATDNLAHLLYPAGFDIRLYAADLSKLVNEGWTGS
jgi:protein SCO1/2